VLTWLCDWVYRLAQAVDSTHRLARGLKRRSKILLSCAEAVTSGAVREARRGCCGVVATGHTHLACLSEMADGVCYANAGCWTEKPASYLTVEDGSIVLHAAP
jgi:UDP-2,3-diacylglucosamine pyrophosphatase LpxH